MKKAILFPVVCLFILSMAFGESLKVTAPNGGESMLLMADNPVVWTFAGFPESRKVTILLFKDGVKVGTIATGVAIGKAGTGSWTWKTGTCQDGIQAGPGPGYRIRVKVEDASILDQSDQPFTIIVFNVFPKPYTPLPTKPPADELVVRTIWMPGETRNKAWTCPYNVAWDQGTGNQYNDPGPGTVQVGFANWADDDGHYAGEVHRCWVFFNVGVLKGKGVLKKATVKLGPKIRCVDLDVDLLCKCERFFVLNEPWNGDPDVLMHTIAISPCPADITPVVAKWMDQPETNYGFVYVPRDDLNLPCGHNNQVCMNEYKGVTIYLDIEMKKNAM